MSPARRGACGGATWRAIISARRSMTYKAGVLSWGLSPSSTVNSSLSKASACSTVGWRMVDSTFSAGDDAAVAGWDAAFNKSVRSSCAACCRSVATATPAWAASVRACAALYSASACVAARASSSACRFMEAIS